MKFHKFHRFMSWVAATVAIACITVFMDLSLQMSLGEQVDIERLSLARRVASFSMLAWLWWSYLAHSGEMEAIDDNFAGIEKVLNEKENP
jgi:hypothetical protein